MKRTTLLLSTAFGLLAFPAAQANAQTAGQAADGGHDGVEEIVVTATKRAESSLEVPMGLTALTGEDLARDQSYRLEDFVGKVPGLNFTQTQGTQLVIRGLATTSASINAPVATYIDETPLVGVGSFSGGSLNTPNLDTYDLSRVEVLKGPQGTLYGASALGGLLKYVTNAPDTSGFAGSVQAGVTSVAHSENIGHNLHGMINIPLGDQLAARVVVYDNLYPGYIDDPTRGVEDVNDTRVYGGRAAVQWEPTNNIALRFTYLNHQREWDGSTVTDVQTTTLNPLYCDLCQGRYEAEPGSSNLDIYNILLTWDFGAVELTSSTTYDEWTYDNLLSLANYNGIFNGVPGASNTGLSVDFYNWGYDRTHETRLVSDNEGFFNWQLGVYYADRKSNQDQTYIIMSEGAFFAEYGGNLAPNTYEELAGFANVTLAFTPTFDISLGGRYSDQEQTFQQLGRGALTALTGEYSTTEDEVFTYSADARWRLTPDSMIYGRIATGFVPGGSNVTPFGVPPGTDFPYTYGSSTTTNYEIGVKTSTLDDRLTLELALFQIDWEDVQVFQQFGVYNAVGTGGTAISKGLEWAVTYMPIDGLTLGFNGALTNAHLTEDASGGQDGDPLPVTPEVQAAASADYEFPMLGNTGFVGADWRYLGERFAEFSAVTARQELPEYHVVDLRAGYRAENWTIGAFVKNVADENVVSYVTGEITPAGPVVRQRAYTLTPRTIGLEFSTSF